MNVRALLMANLCFKLFLVGLCLLLVRVHYMFSDSFAWFRPAASEREVTDALERESADVNARNKDGLTGLILAAKNNDFNRAKAILDAYPKLNLTSDDMYRRTALHWACYNADKQETRELIRMLVERGADLHVTDYEGATPLRLLARLDDIDVNMDMVAFLAKHGADIGARDDRGMSLLHRKIFRRDQAYVRAYLDRLKTLLNRVDLADAARYAHSYMTDYLAQLIREAAARRPDVLGTDRIDWHDEHGLGTVSQAVIRDDELIAHRLFDNGVDVNDKSRDEFEFTALHIATMRQAVNWMQRLLKAGADRLMQDARGNTALHWVAGISNSPVARNLVHTLADDLKDPSAFLNMRNSDGDTVMHKAIRLDNRDLISFLAEQYGQYIDHTLENNDSQNLLQLAQALGRDEIAQVLVGEQQRG